MQNGQSKFVCIIVIYNYGPALEGCKFTNARGEPAQVPCQHIQSGLRLRVLFLCLAQSDACSDATKHLDYTAQTSKTAAPSAAPAGAASLR